MDDSPIPRELIDESIAREREYRIRLEEENRRAEQDAAFGVEAMRQNRRELEEYQGTENSIRRANERDTGAMYRRMRDEANIETSIDSENSSSTLQRLQNQGIMFNALPPQDNPEDSDSSDSEDSEEPEESYLLTINYPDLPSQMLEIYTVGDYKAVLSEDGIIIALIGDSFENPVNNTPISSDEPIVFFVMSIIDDDLIVWMTTGQEIILYNVMTEHRWSSPTECYSLCAFSNRGFFINDLDGSAITEIIIRNNSFENVEMDDHSFNEPITKVTCNDSFIKILADNILYVREFDLDDSFIDIGTLVDDISSSYVIRDRQIYDVVNVDDFPTLNLFRVIPFRPRYIKSDIADQSLINPAVICNLSNGNVINVDLHNDVALCDDGTTILVLTSDSVKTYSLE